MNDVIIALFRHSMHHTFGFHLVGVVLSVPGVNIHVSVSVCVCVFGWGSCEAKALLRSLHHVRILLGFFVTFTLVFIMVFHGSQVLALSQHLAF